MRYGAYQLFLDIILKFVQNMYCWVMLFYYSVCTGSLRWKSYFECFLLTMHFCWNCLWSIHPINIVVSSSDTFLLSDEKFESLPWRKWLISVPKWQFYCHLFLCRRLQQRFFSSRYWEKLYWRLQHSTLSWLLMILSNHSRWRHLSFCGGCWGIVGIMGKRLCSCLDAVDWRRFPHDFSSATDHRKYGICTLSCAPMILPIQPLCYQFICDAQSLSVVTFI